MIQSIYYDFGSGIVAGDTGIIPQNRGSFFSLDANHVNTLEPGKRTFHTLIPSLLTKNGEPWLVYGTMGGEGQPQTQAALVSRIVDFGYDVQEAIEAPRWLFGRTWGEESKSLSLEGRIPTGLPPNSNAGGNRWQWLVMSTTRWAMPQQSGSTGLVRLKGEPIPEVMGQRSATEIGQPGPVSVSSPRYHPTTYAPASALMSRFDCSVSFSSTSKWGKTCAHS